MLRDREERKGGNNRDPDAGANCRVGYGGKGGFGRGRASSWPDHLMGTCARDGGYVATPSGPPAGTSGSEGATFRGLSAEAGGGAGGAALGAGAGSARRRGALAGTRGPTLGTRARRLLGLAVGGFEVFGLEVGPFGDLADFFPHFLLEPVGGFGVGGRFGVVPLAVAHEEEDVSAGWREWLVGVMR
ncbi:hypothetical protein MRB53_042074 [Persea americana]|nr:hypothetical protein MRB53_042074 [Persea americana]